MTDLSARAKAISLLLLDIDGIFTDGIIYFGEQGSGKGFHIQDGFGIKLLQSTGVEIGVISGKKADYLQERLQSIGIKHIYLGHEKKLPIYEKIKLQLMMRDQQIAYMGDELIDLPILTRVGLAVTVPDGHDAVKAHCHHITKRLGGHGAIREICDLIMQAQGHYQRIIESYLI